MKLLILGATGGTGKHLLSFALAQGHDVTVLVRDAAKIDASVSANPKLRVVTGNVTNTADVEKALAGQDAVLGALGPRDKADPICADAAAALVAAMKKTGVKRVVWLSASGVGDSYVGVAKASFIFAKIILPLALKKPYANHLRAEEALRASDLDWLVDENGGKTVTYVAPDQAPKGMKIARRDVATAMLTDVTTNAHVREMPMIHT